MRTEVYLVRHGTTKYNAERRYYGREDEPLNETGRLQAEYLARRLSGTGIDAVYSSPLSRAVDTVRPYAEERGLVLRLDERLIERDGGRMSLTLIRDMYAVVPPDEMERLRINPALFTYGGAEPAETVYARVGRALWEICARHSGGRICISSHAFSLRMLLAFALGLPPRRFMAALPNASLSLIVEEDGAFRQEYIGDDSFLPESLRQNVDPGYVFARPDESDYTRKG